MLSMTVSNLWRKIRDTNGDLLVTLSAPSGTSVVLHNRSGGPADNIKRTLDLASTPELSILTGQPIQGNWTLHIQDLEAVDVGKLNRWELEIQAQ
jgi:subtilisin-like proprotein convertase family protein